MIREMLISNTVSSNIWELGTVVGLHRALGKNELGLNDSWNADLQYCLSLSSVI